MRKNLAQLASVIVVAVILLGIGVGAQRPWYTGGTLHESTRQEWLAATERDRLATSIDWVITLWSREGYSSDLIRSMRSGGGWREAAQQTVDCINETYDLGVTDDPQVLAALCYYAE